MPRSILIIAGVLLLVWVGGRVSNSWVSYLKNDPHAVKLDTKGARQAVEALDRRWAAASSSFVAGDFYETQSEFEAGLQEIAKYAPRFANEPYADGLSFQAWMEAHQIAWIESLQLLRERLAVEIADDADLTSLERLRRRLGSPAFDSLAALIKDDVADHARRHPAVLVVSLEGGAVPRSAMLDLAREFVPDPDECYVIFSGVAEAAALGDLNFVGSVRLTSFHTLCFYNFYEDGRLPPPGVVRDSGIGGTKFGIPSRIRLLLEPDPYAQENFNIARRVCSSVTTELPETMLLGAQDPADFVASHRAGLLDSLRAAVGELPPMVLRGEPRAGLSSLRPLPVLFAGEMPTLAADSEVEQVFGR